MPTFIVPARYDAVALLAALPATRHFFQPTIKRVHGVEHLVIGTSEKEPGIHPTRVGELQDFLYTSFFRGVTMDFSEFEQTKATMETSEELKTRKGRILKAQSSRSVKMTEPSSPEPAPSTPVQPLHKASKNGKVTPLPSP